MGRLPNRLPIYQIGTTGVTDVIHLEDNEKFYLGTGKDTQIYYDGTDLKIEPDAVGSGKIDCLADMSFPTDDDGIHFGAADDVKIFWDGTHFILESLSLTKMAIGFYTANTRLYGDHTAGSSIRLYGSTEDTYSWLRVLGGGGITNYIKSGSSFVISHATTQSLEVTYSSNVTTVHGGVTSGDDLELEANTTDTGAAIILEGNGDVALNPTSGSFVKFGTYAADVKTESTGYIEIQDSGGTARRLMVQAT